MPHLLKIIKNLTRAQVSFSNVVGGSLLNNGGHLDAYNVAAEAVTGGVGSVIGGGSFENGAITGSFRYLFSQEVQAVANGQNPVQQIGQGLDNLGGDIRYAYDSLVGINANPINQNPIGQNLTDQALYGEALQAQASDGQSAIGLEQVADKRSFSYKVMCLWCVFQTSMPQIFRDAEQPDPIEVPELVIEEQTTAQPKQPK
ncbi:MAG: hypothetical protein KGQ26_08105 [Rhodospirillales bacterium]|nr:hypothetical protein [Rhodospirillales bacterium]